MNEQFMQSVRQDAEVRSQALQRLLSGADASRVFGQPVSSGEYTVIPAAEVAAGGGFGSGMGFGGPRWRGRGVNAEPGIAEPGTPGDESGLAVEGGGSGGGGGGGAMGRPVAVVVVGPDGVKVKPVVDFTKLALTALTAWGAVAALSVRLWAKK